MNTMIKRGTMFALAFLMLVTSMLVPIRKAKAATAYYNTASASLNCNINSSGHLTASMSVTGYKGVTTKISVELYIEKKILGIFWTRVDIGCTDNIWKDSKTGFSYSNTFPFDLTSGGTYRVTATYTVSGTGGTDDIIVRTDTATY